MAQAARKLAAIMLADIAGYSSLMERDEDGTFARLRSVREEVITPIVILYGGRVIEMTGDGFLAEFPTASAAVQCGIDILRLNHKQELKFDAADRFHWRIGINLGDIIIDGDAVSGDVVNVAARLETLAPPDGICVSAAVRDQIRDNAGLVFEDLGEQAVKNIARPIHVFRITVAPTGPPKRSKPKPSLVKPLLAVATGLALLSGGWFYRDWVNRRPAPHLSIVVLPFGNASGDPAEDYVADAITDDITVELSKIKGSFVIGRGTAFSFKGKQPDPRAVARELNVRYILQGTASKAAGNFHVTVELIDGVTGANIWADAIDHDVRNVDEVRRDVVRHLASTLNLQLISAESKIAGRARDPDAIDLTMRAWANYNQNRVIPEILALLEKALALQPTYEPALVLRANVKADSYAQNPAAGGDQLLAEAEQDALRAIELDHTDAMAYQALAEIKRYQHKISDAILANNRALDLNPNDANAVSLQARLLIEDGKAALAIDQADKAISLSPLDANLFASLWAKCNAYIHLANFAEALPVCERTWGMYQLWFNAAALMDVYVNLGDQKKATAIKNVIMAKNPNFSIGFYKETLGKDNFIFQKKVQEDILLSFRKAGISE